MRALILTISAGQGHNQTGIAISDYLEEKGVTCMTLDAYKYISSALGDGVEKGYLLSTKYLPGIYGKMYRLFEKKEGEEMAISKAANKLFTGKVVRFIRQFDPDVVICTHIFAAMIVTSAREKLSGIKSIGIVTDFTIHPFWEDTVLDYYITASHLLDWQCFKKGIAPEKIKSLGIPIHEKFSRAMPKEEAYDVLGIDHKSTLLVMLGSMGFGNVPRMVEQIDKLSIDFQILCVCGRNERAREKISAMDWKHPVHCYGFVDNVDVMMDAADFIVTKPGGLSVSESLAKGLPMILVNPIPGQEDRNLEFLLNNGLGLAVTETFPLEEAVFQLYHNQWRREHLGEGVRYIGKPNAARDVGDLALSLARKDAP